MNIYEGIPATKARQRGAGGTCQAALHVPLEGQSTTREPLGASTRGVCRWGMCWGPSSPCQDNMIVSQDHMIDLPYQPKLDKTLDNSLSFTFKQQYSIS